MLKPIGKLVCGMQAILCVSLVAVPVSASENRSNPTVTPFIGYRTGGEFEDAATGRHLDIEESEVLGLIVGWDVRPG